MKPDDARRQLGEFLRTRRDQLRPEEFDLPRGNRRRAPGLRREEAAQLCGISPTWFAWIEQGRTTAISVASLAAIARGLRLSQAERRYLFELGGRKDPRQPGAERVDAVLLQTLVDSARSPSYVLDRHWNALAWNRPAARLFAAWLGRRAISPLPSLLEYVFLDVSARRFIVDWSQRARRLVGEYRADTAAWQDDPVRQALVHELATASADFRAAWEAQEVFTREGGLRSFNKPGAGRQDFQQFTLRPAQWPELKLVILTPVID
jgi:transcriptional regulator with XRE-family HTH domain